MRILVALLVALAWCVSPAAQAQSTADPLDVVKKFYVANQNNGERYEPWSRRLRGLYDAASKKSAALNEPVSGIDFDPTINGQDSEENFQKTVRAAQTQRSDGKARIKVTFRNGRPSELWYDMTLEDGRWVVDDIRSVKGEAKWVWSKLLRDGAQGK